MNHIAALINILLRGKFTSAKVNILSDIMQYAQWAQNILTTLKILSHDSMPRYSDVVYKLQKLVQH